MIEIFYIFNKFNIINLFPTLNTIVYIIVVNNNKQKYGLYLFFPLKFN